MSEVNTEQTTEVKADEVKAEEVKAEVNESPKVETEVKAEAKAEAKAEGNEQKTESKESESKVPEKYELKLPEGSLLDQSHIEKIASLAKERGFSQDVAQAILDSKAEAVKEFVQDTAPNGKLWTQQVEKWESEALKSKEIGGTPEKLQESVVLAKRAMERFFPKEAVDYLDQSGLGSHPAVITALRRIGEAMSNDKVEKGPSGSSSAKTLEERLYGVRSE